MNQTRDRMESASPNHERVVSCIFHTMGEQRRCVTFECVEDSNLRFELLKCQSRFLLLWNCQALTTSLSRGTAPWAREWGTFSQVKCSWALCATTNRSPIHESAALPYGMCWADDIGSLWLPMGKAPVYACWLYSWEYQLRITCRVWHLSLFWEKIAIKKRKIKRNIRRYLYRIWIV